MAKSTDVKIRITGDSASYTSQVFKATAANDALNKSVHGVSKGLIAINGPLSGVTARFEAMRGILSSGAAGWVALGAAITGASTILLSSVRTFSRYEQSQKTLEQLVLSTGYAAGLTADQLMKQADQVALTTLASVEGIREAQGVLLTFKSVQGETFKEAIRLSQDMAAVFGGTAKDKALQLGKALEDPAQGITALKRSGVDFTEGQREMIRSLVDTGNVADAQRIILERVAGQMGDSAVAQARSLAGSYDTLTQRWDEFKLSLVQSTDADQAAAGLLDTLSNGLERIAGVINPGEQERFNKLFAERLELQAELQKLESGDQGFISSIFGGDAATEDGIKQRLSVIDQELTQIQDRKVAATKKEAAAIEAAEKAAEEAAAERRKAAEAEAAKRREAAEEAAAERREAAEAEAAEKESKRLDGGLERLRKNLASKQEAEEMAYAERARLIEELAQADKITQDERWVLDTANFENYHRRLTEIQKTELDKQVADAKAADDAVAQSKRDLVSAAASANDGLISVLESSNKKQSGLYKAALAVQKASQFAMALASANTAAEGVRAREAPVMGFQANTAAEITRGLGYAGAASILGVQIAGAFENGGIVPGNSYTGDNLTAAVNSSEMILNRAQQRNLFDMANGKASGSGGNTTVQVINASSNSTIKERQSMGPDGQMIKQYLIADMDADEEFTQRMMSKFRLNPYGS